MRKCAYSRSESVSGEMEEKRDRSRFEERAGRKADVHPLRKISEEYGGITLVRVDGLQQILVSSEAARCRCRSDGTRGRL